MDLILGSSSTTTFPSQCPLSPSWMWLFPSVILLLLLSPPGARHSPSLLCADALIMTWLTEKIETIRRKLLYPLITKCSMLLVPVPFTGYLLSCYRKSTAHTLMWGQHCYWHGEVHFFLATWEFFSCNDATSLVSLIFHCLQDYFPTYTHILLSLTLKTEQNKT